MGSSVELVVGVSVGIVFVGVAIATVILVRGFRGGGKQSRGRSHSSRRTNASSTMESGGDYYQAIGTESTYGDGARGGQGHVIAPPPVLGAAEVEVTSPRTPKGGASVEDEESVAQRDSVPEVRYRKILSAIKKGTRVAAGNFGEVFRCKLDGKIVAIKRMHLNVNDRKALDDFRMEIELLGKMRHPNVLPIYGACTVAPNLCFVSEFMGRGSLFDVIHKTPETLNWERRLRVALDAALGMEYLHSLSPKVVHRDLKSMNIMIGDDFGTRIGDFGISRTVELSGAELTTKHIAGSPAWMAGEVLRGERSTDKVDVYAFGVILWELLTLSIPWGGRSYADLVRIVGLGGGRLKIPTPLPQGCPPSLPSLIGRCCDPTAAMRPSFSQVTAVLRDMVTAAGIQSGGANMFEKFGDLSDPLMK